MKNASLDFDVLIAGAGPAGTLMARNLAANGVKVGLFDSTPETQPYKQLVVEVERGIFETTSVEFPSKNDIPYHPARMRVFSTKGKNVFNRDGSLLPVAIYQDRVVEKILHDAVRNGAVYQKGFTALNPIIDGTVTKGAVFATADGRRHEVKASITVDATGFPAALVRAMPPELGFDFPEGIEHQVTASCRLHEAEPILAMKAVREGLHGDNELYCRFGMYGSYSTVFSYLSVEKSRAYILIGFKNGFGSIEKAVNSYRNSQGYFGNQLHGGSGLIRIRHSLDRLVSDGFMAVGEAACMVFPVSGSGVASALYAAKLASESASKAILASDMSTAALWGYSAGYQQTRGRTMAGLDISRLTVDKLSANQIGAMLENGLMTSEDMNAAADPQPPKISSDSIPGRLKGLVRNPDLIPKLSIMGVCLQKTLKHYLKYPDRFETKTFNAWKKQNLKNFSMVN